MILLTREAHLPLCYTSMWGACTPHVSHSTLRITPVPTVLLPSPVNPVSEVCHRHVAIGRNGRIRTGDPLSPRRVR